MTQKTASPPPRFERSADSTEIAQAPRPPVSRLASALSGGLILALSLFALSQLKLESDLLGPALLIGLVVGMVSGALQWNWVGWVTGILVVGLLITIAFTPMVPKLLAASEPADTLGPADAVVALGAGSHNDGTPDAASQDRALHAIQMVRLGYTKRVVLSGMLYTPYILDMVRDLGNDCEVLQTGPVGNTHDEALAVAAMARDHKWTRVILVTESWHMPRAAAVFRSAGVEAVRSPCLESRYDLHDLKNTGERMLALRDWIHEAIGVRVYRARGWITAAGEAQ